MRQQSSNNDSETKTAGAALPAAEAQQSKGGCISDNYSFRTNRSNRSSRSNGSDNIVTVNGGHGTKSSSIIYLSPDTKKPPKPQRSNSSGPCNNDGGNEDEDPWNRTTFITVNHPAVHMSVQPHSTTIEVRNSETSTGSEPFTEEEEEEEDTGSCISDDSSDTSDKERTSSEEEHNHLQSVINNENLKLLNKVKVFQEKQKKAAAAAAEEQREKENKEALQELDRALDIGGGDSAAEESDYDADCSQLESPRKVQSVIASMLSDHDSASPQRTPRKRQAVVVVPDAAAIPEEEETQDSFQTIVAAAGPLATKRSSDSLPKGAKKKPTARLLFDNPTATTKSAQLAERRNKQISKESRSVSDTSIASGGQHTSKPAESEEEFQPNISKGFSCEILKELYGSKTSLVRKPSSSSGGESAMSGGDNHGGESYKRRQRMPGKLNIANKIIFSFFSNSC